MPGKNALYASGLVAFFAAVAVVGSQVGDPFKKSRPHSLGTESEIAAQIQTALNNSVPAHDTARLRVACSNTDVVVYDIAKCGATTYRSVPTVATDPVSGAIAYKCDVRTNYPENRLVHSATENQGIAEIATAIFNANPSDRTAITSNCPGRYKLPESSRDLTR